MEKRMCNGQTLVETVFTIAVAGLLLAGLVFGMIYFTKAARSARYRAWATNLGQEKLETLRALRDNSSETFWQIASGAIASPDDFEENLTAPAEFLRETAFSEFQNLAGGTRSVKATITLTWRDGGAEKTLAVSTYFTD
jgi:type II secretory pathway pseudopilin PulG